MTKTTTKYRTFGVAAIVAILSVSMVAIALSQSAIAAPANKSAFGGEGVGALPDDDKFHTIAYGTIKTSSPSDLLVLHDQECTIHTGLNLDKNNQDQTSAIREDVRLKVSDIDDTNVRYIDPVPLYYEGKSVADGGVETDEYSEETITMCGRAYHIETNILEMIFELCQFVNGQVPDTCTETEPFFDSFIRTKQAHGWSWVVPNMGSGEHKIEVQAKLVNYLDAVGDTTGKKGKATDTPCDPQVDTQCVDTILEVGKRTLIITEEKFVNSATPGSGE